MVIDEHRNSLDRIEHNKDTSSVDNKINKTGTKKTPTLEKETKIFVRPQKIVESASQVIQGNGA